MNLRFVSFVVVSSLAAVGSFASADTLPAQVTSDPGVSAVLSDPSVTCVRSATIDGGYYTCRTHGAPSYSGSLSDMTTVKGTLGRGVDAEAVPLALPGHLGVAAWLVYPRAGGTHILVPSGDFMAKFEDGYFDTFSKIYDPADANCCPKNVTRRRYAFARNTLRKVDVKKMPAPQ